MPLQAATKSTELLEMVIRCIPYPEQIRELDLTRRDSVRFVWRGVHFAVREGLHVEEIQGDMLACSNVAMLLESLVRKAYTEL